MRKGDRAFLYHSSCDVPGIAGVVEVVRTAYPDPTAFQKKHVHYDEGSDPDNPRWYVVDVRLERRLKRVITLDELRQHETYVVLAQELFGCRHVHHVTPPWLQTSRTTSSRDDFK